MARMKLTKLTAKEELTFLFQIYGERNYDRILAALTESYNVLQARAQLLISLITICLTIAGFSGPNIAASSPIAKACVGYGLLFILASAVVTLIGPLQLRWATQWKAENVEASLVALIERRNSRSAKYHLALVFLIVGMAGYVGGTIGYVFHL